MIGFAHAAEAGAAQPNPLFGLLPWVAVFAVLYFLVILPNKKREKARQEMISSLKKGDRVMLSSGFYGRIAKSGENIISVELGKGLVVEVDRNAIAAKVEEPSAEAPAE